jgi:hypothetical protein
MYSQLVAYFKTKSTLAYHGMTIVSWSLLLASNARAQNPPIDSQLDLPGVQPINSTPIPNDLTIVIPPLPSIFQAIPLNSIITPELIPAPNNTPAVPSINAPTAPKLLRDPRFIIPPQVLESQVVDPFSTQFVLNGNKVSHFTTTVANTGYESGNFRNSDLRIANSKLLE